MGCEWCKRTVVVKAISLTDPDFTTELVANWLSGLLSTSCVTVRAFGEVPHPEYGIVVRFEKNEEGKFKWLKDLGTKWEHNEKYQIEPVNSAKDTTGVGDNLRRSIMNLTIFMCEGILTPKGFFGARIDVEDFGHLVDSWITEEASMSLEVHKGLMMDNLNQLLPLENYLWDYEQTPAKCQIDPKKIEVEPGEEIEIKLTNWKDRKGNPINREIYVMNRILIKVEKGKLMNTDGTDPTSTENDPDLKVFGFLDYERTKGKTFKYIAPPEPITEDVIHVYYSCDILDHLKILPMPKTKKKEEILQKKVRIKCDYSLNVDVNVHWDIDNENNTELGNYDVNIQGIMEKSKKYSKGGIPHYIPKEMKASYTYQNVFRLKNPQCELEGYEESASGEVPLKYSAKSPLAIHLKIHELKKHYKGKAPKDSEAILGQISGAMPEGLEMMQKMIAKSMPQMQEMVEKLSAVMPQGLGGTTIKGMKQGKGMLLDRYELVISCTSAPKQLRNIKRTRCIWDEAAQKVVPINEEDTGPILNGFTIYIHSIMGENNQMSGSHSWDAKEYSLGKIEINELAKTLEQYTSKKLEPFKPREEPGENVKINVQWNLKRA